MWCPACRADVAAELSLDSRHFRCARCTTELGTAAGSLGAALPVPASPTDAERNARELLARWSAQNLLASASTARPVADAAPLPGLPREAESAPVSTDAAPPATQSAEQDPQSTTLGIPDDDPLPPRKKRRVDRSEYQRRSPERSAQGGERIPAARTPSWGGTVGQMCAYFGIGLITCGTSVVLWGYFGGPAHFAPTGWLVTTIGQMFLFLGIVTLISSGMEQTTAEVADRIDVLGRRLIRIENRQRNHDLTGPHERRSKRRRGPPSSSSQDDLAADSA